MSKEILLPKEERNMPSHVILSKEDIERLVKDIIDVIVDIVSRDYVTKVQYEKDMQALKDEIASLRPNTEDPSVKEVIEGICKIGLPDSTVHIVDNYDPVIHNEHDVVYTDRHGNQWFNGLPISETVKEREVYHSPVYKSIDSKEDTKPELTEFTQDDLNKYSSRAFGAAPANPFISVQSKSNPSIDECKSKWDELHNSLQSQWDDLVTPKG